MWVAAPHGLALCGCWHVHSHPWAQLGAIGWVVGCTCGLAHNPTHECRFGPLNTKFMVKLRACHAETGLIIFCTTTTLTPRLRPTTLIIAPVSFEHFSNWGGVPLGQGDPSDRFCTIAPHTSDGTASPGPQRASGRPSGCLGPARCRWSGGLGGIWARHFTCAEMLDKC